MKKNEKLVIVGAGEFAMIAYEYFTYDSDYDVAAFSVEKEFLSNDTLYDKPIVQFEALEDSFPSSEYDVFVAVSATKLNRVRTRLYNEMKVRGYKCATYISSRAFVWRNAKVGENCFIFENNTIQPFVEIGNNVILWSGNHIGHRTVIADHCFISSHAVISGYCRIGASCFVGVNSTFNDRVTVADSCIIASASLVSKNLKEKERIYYGSPIKQMPKKSALNVSL